MSTNIITASNLVVAGNIAVGGFIQQGTTLSQGNVNVGSITISGVQLEVSGTTLNFSGANLTALTICGAPIGGGGGWVGEATTDLSMNGLNILNVNRISGSDGILTFNTSQYAGFSDGVNDATVFINPSFGFVAINAGLQIPTAADEKLYVGGNTIITGSCAIGTTTLSGALNVSGTICVNDYAQPFIQYGEGTLAAGTVTITPTVPYGNAFYSIAIAPKADNSGFYVDGILSNQFSVSAANSTGAETWAFLWTTLGNL